MPKGKKYGGSKSGGSKSGGDNAMLDKAVKDGLLTQKQRSNLPPHLLVAIVKSKKKKKSK
jgi:hypothetical protein